MIRFEDVHERGKTAINVIHILFAVGVLFFFAMIMAAPEDSGVSRTFVFVLGGISATSLIATFILLMALDKICEEGVSARERIAKMPHK